MIIPEVTLLKIDQIAKRPIPMTANTDDTIKVKSLNSTPRIAASIVKAIIQREQVFEDFVPKIIIVIVLHNVCMLHDNSS